MKKILTIVVALLITASVWAQAPEKMSYQAVIRDANNALIINQNVGMQISILQTTANGTAVYVETQSVTTNANGLVSLEIGTGTTTDDFSAIDWANDTYFIKTETDPEGGTNYTITGTSQLMSVPYALHAKTAENITGTITENDPLYTQSVASEITTTDTTNWNNATQSLSITGNQLTISSGNTVSLPAGGGGSVPVYTTDQITSLSPAEGDVVFNNTENLYQIYEGGEWHSFNTNCWPEPTIADAGADQTFTDETTSTTLSANTPASQHGSGSWSILSGTGGSFAEDTNPSTTFTGIECTTYTLQWTISTSCDTSSDSIIISFNQTPTIADAGTDQTFTDGTTSATLAANNSATGSWSIINGTGGSFANNTDPNTTFTGTLHTAYTLQWTTSTNCSSSTDDVTITFNQDGAGSPITDYDGNTYNTAYIGNQLWMTENLATTHQADGTAIPTVTDDNADGSTDDEWEALGDNDTDMAYCNSASGAFYTYAAALNACPTGWHLPTDEEWTELENYIANDGYSETEGTTLKSTSYWEENGNGTDIYGFSAFPVGSRYDGTGTFDGEGYNGNWWSSTDSDSNSAYFRFLHYNYPFLYRFSFNKSNGFNVRCIHDN